MATVNETVKKVLEDLRKNGGGIKIIEQNSNGAIAWRIWSNGFIEQWLTSSDTLLHGNESMNKTFTFPKPFSDTSYALVGVGILVDGTGRQYADKEATGFRTRSDVTNTGTGGWYACGF